ncbi:MAG: hypothetical protein A3J38_02915 [Gammaproteobacteria bacterium RIFCSPHIGHO2_12_FULL_45_9]|nr:MAG: hypothetical protein A3J38_02915 [Gammaproteobacteria bacterium RIFCSPHIGHO2_12_FULL_45_9]
MIEGILFDLDGTLLDTAPQLIDALNQLLTYYGRPQESPDVLRPLVGEGTRRILQHAFGIDSTHPDFHYLRQTYWTIYQMQILQTPSQPFPGIVPLLYTLVENHIPWGIVTNKPDWLARPLIEALALPQCQCLIGSETLPERKPHPLPLLYGCQSLQTAFQHTLYIGDTLIDMRAAEAAGLHGAIALFGYAPPLTISAHWPHAYKIHNPLDLLNIIFKIPNETRDLMHHVRKMG